MHRRLLVGVLMVVALLETACTDVGRSSETTTATGGARYQVVEPVHRVDPLPGSGGMYGSGCTPGSSTLPDGIWFGAWTSVSTSSADFDLMCLEPGPDDGTDTLTNASPQRRTVDLHADARVWRLSDDATRWDPMPVAQWLGTPPSEACPRPCPVWLYLNDGRVTEIVELFFA